MEIKNVPFSCIDWSKIEPSVHPGETGVATWHTVEQGNIRVRMVEYSANYMADHWCSRGHVLLVLEGELVTELQNGETFRLSQGMSYQVENDTTPHRSRTKLGARIFIVD